MTTFDPERHDRATCERKPCRKCSQPVTRTIPNVSRVSFAGATNRTNGAVAALGLPSHPSMKTLAEGMRRTEGLLAHNGERAIAMASTLAARGWAASTLGDGGSRGTDATSGPERAVTADRKDRWAGVDRLFAQELQDLARLTLRVELRIEDLLQHAEDLDPIPVGTGDCQACSRFVRPTKDRPGFRLRSGLCPSCHGAWRKADNPDRSDWVRARRNRLTDINGKVHPEDMSEMDLTRELAE